MPKQNNYTLTEEELKQVLEALKSPIARLAKRALVLHSLHLGYTPEEVAEVQDLSLATIYNHYNRFKGEGLKGLIDKPKQGRPPKANEAYRKRLIQVIEINPADFGFGFTVWTLPSLAEYLRRETGVPLSQNRLAEVLQEEGYVYRCPKKDLGHKQDTQLREEVKEALDELKKTPQTKILGYSLWTKADSL
jgi:putative transposase